MSLSSSLMRWRGVSSQALYIGNLSVAPPLDSTIIHSETNPTSSRVKILFCRIVHDHQREAPLYTERPGSEAKC